MYFSGFCFSNESLIFKDLLEGLSIYDVCGFSYGAQKACEWVYERLEKQRIQRLILISPAIFQNKSKAYKEMQINAFKKNHKKYIQAFLHSAGFEQTMKKYFSKGNIKELQDLLKYTWDDYKLKKINEFGIEIEVYLGEEDKIIDSSYACNFFSSYARVYYIKYANHFLKPTHRYLLNK